MYICYIDLRLHSELSSNIYWQDATTFIGIGFRQMLLAQ